MPLTLRKRPRLGDVIEIGTPEGFAYAQYSHKTPSYGPLIRVLPGLFASRPSAFGELVEQPERFLVFFPLGPACNRGMVQVVAEEPIPPAAQAFPLFRRGLADREGQVKQWFLWDGDRDSPIEELTPDLLKLPIHLGIWNASLLVERIASGWIPSDEALIIGR